MIAAERGFPRFVYGVAGGVYRASLTDPDVFLLAVSGTLLGARRRRLRGFGIALGAYVTFRRLDRYVDVGVQIAKLAQLNKRVTIQPFPDPQQV